MFEIRSYLDVNPSRARDLGGTIRTIVSDDVYVVAIQGIVDPCQAAEHGPDQRFFIVRRYHYRKAANRLFSSWRMGATNRANGCANGKSQQIEKRQSKQ
jgi:hypothetical protein